MSGKKSKKSDGKRKSKKLVVATLGAAAAAAVAGVAVAKLRSGGRSTVLHVRSGEHGWVLLSGRDDEPLASFATKREAVAAGRAAAHECVPSELVVHRSDGSVQRHHSYEA